ncbi:Sec63 Brl domain-containing protein [Mycotypha africana]|uniref:Sec63 Brl domain-containing protein n=1 Tax=Mycotypha africana TaxID=64632 RepID=UPI002301D110|nr:Sec63 Brl domain-containing protein [Mycotypha africana]KAI8973324.1 Sec63 Brl domain-containing protein [Mycotypha africana]
MAQYNYDEQGFNFYYFLISVLSLALVPTTVQTFYSLFKGSGKKQNLCQCNTCQKERKKSNATKPNAIKKLITSPKFLFLLIGWIGVVLLTMQVANAEIKTATWDPYEILGVKEGASLAEIKKTYKKLSLVYHPDKAKPGEEEKNEETFIDITKAYKVLTDEDTRRNYEEFGHPDGKQSFTMGVALPKGLVEGNGMYVLGFYAIAFGLGLPYFIARWWYKSRRLTKDKILNKTMGVFVKGLKEDSEFNDLIYILAGAHEFKENTDYRGNEGNILKSIDNAIAEELESRFGEKYDRLDKDESIPSYRRKARTLLFAHFLRVELESKHATKALLKDQKYIVDKSVHLLYGLLQISTVKQWLSTTSQIMELQQHLLQATYPGDATIKQLPHISQNFLRKANRNRKNKINTVQQLLAMNEHDRKEFLKSLGSDDAYLDVLEVAQRIPKLNVKKATFKVVGDRMVTTGAIITFILKLKNGEVTEMDIEQEKQIDENDEVDEAVIDEAADKKKKKNTNKPTLPLGHTPYYPSEKKPCWWIFLGDPKVNRILVPHQKVTDIVDEETIKIAFPGPPKPGVYTFSVFVKSDTYSGTDIFQDVKLEVHDPSELPPEDDVDDTISEPEEDSIAGQMKLMREQGFASALAGGSTKKKPEDSDSDSDSSDEEEEDGTSTKKNDSDVTTSDSDSD